MRIPYEAVEILRSTAHCTRVYYKLKQNETCFWCYYFFTICRIRIFKQQFALHNDNAIHITLTCDCLNIIRNSKQPAASCTRNDQPSRR